MVCWILRMKIQACILDRDNVEICHFRLDLFVRGRELCCGAPALFDHGWLSMHRL
jgi:hypothetical protein